MRILLNNIKESFNKILKRSVFGKTCICIIVAFDVDAICALRILTSLLNREHLQFRIIPVSGYGEMVEAIQNCGTFYKSLIFINCGNLYDMARFLSEDVRFFIFDSHQPIYHGNVNNTRQIYIIDDGMGQLEKCPDEDRFELSESEPELDDEDDEEDDPLGDDSNRQSEIHSKQKKKFIKQKRKMMQRVNQMHDEYYNYGTYYSRPTATVIYTMAQQLNHDCNEHLWFAILGLTDAFVHMRTSQKNYDQIFNDLQNEVYRLNIYYENTQQNPEEVPIENNNKRIGTIAIENEYKFFLYRYQSLYKSIYYSSYVGTKLELWKDKNNNKLEEFIVRVGIPLEEAKQQFQYMNQKYKVLLRQKISEVSQKFQMDDIMYRSFVSQVDSKLQVTATDMVHAIAAILEYPPSLLNKELSQHQCSLTIEKLRTESVAMQKFQNFWCALDALDLKQTDLLEQGVKLALEFQEGLVDKAKNLIEKKEVFPAKHFRYAILKNETGSTKNLFQHHQSMIKLAKLLMDIFKERNYKQANKSVVVVNKKVNTDRFIVVGVVGGMSFVNSEKNQFGNYFLQVVHEKQLQFVQDSFETSVIEIHQDDLDTFIDEIVDYKK